MRVRVPPPAPVETIAPLEVERSRHEAFGRSLPSTCAQLVLNLCWSELDSRNTPDRNGEESELWVY